MTDSPDGNKLQKLLAQASVGSRRAMEKVISAGRVTINGKKATLGERAKGTDTIAVDGVRIGLTEQNTAGRVLIYNKPGGGKYVPAAIPKVVELFLSVCPN